VKTLRLFYKGLSRNKIGFVGFLVAIGIILFAYVGPRIVPLDTEVRILKIYQPPSAEHWLGTDHQGRDVFSYLVHGGRDVLRVAFLAAALTSLIAVSLGALAGFIGGRFDAAVLAITDFWMTIPEFPVLAVLATVLKIKNMNVLAVILALLAWPILMRAVRAQILSLKEQEFVQAARALDLGTPHIVFREILPNMASYILITFIFGMRQAIYAQTSLVFLGLVPFVAENWGVMVQYAYARGAIFFKDSIWYIMGPITMIAIFQLALVSMTRSLDELFNPRLRTGD
jgi:peptide/nickel transport system permease protein